MKRFLIAIFAITLLTAGAPLFAQSQDEPTTSELQSEQMENAPATGTEVETETELDGDTEVEVEVDENDLDASLDADAEVEADLDDESYDDDELPATGSELPLAALLGLASLAGAATLRVRS